jgi:hypothetical protein
MEAICGSGHGCTAASFPRGAPAGEREEGEKGKKRKKNGGEVAADRWGWAVGGTGAGCTGRRVGWAATGPTEEGGLIGWLRPT